MDQIKFKELLDQLQNTQEVALNSDSRRQFYFRFNDIYNYLDGGEWTEDHLKEQHEYKENAYFQNVAEGFFRLGFFEKAFFQCSKLIYELWYKKVIQFQIKFHKRIHKGTQLHQIATIHEIFNELDKSWNYFFAGLIEDVIDGRSINDSQAFRSLRRFNLPKNNLSLIAAEVNKIKGLATFDPLGIVDNLRRTFIVPSYKENESIDSNKLNRAKELWEKLLQKRKGNYA